VYKLGSHRRAACHDAAKSSTDAKRSPGSASRAYSSVVEIDQVVESGK
jgi:hypothetical protein